MQFRASNLVEVDTVVFQQGTRRGTSLAEHPGLFSELRLFRSVSPETMSLYLDECTVDTVAAPRAINCNGKGRGKVTEVVVRNY